MLNLNNAAEVEASLQVSFMSHRKVRPVRAARGERVAHQGLLEIHLEFARAGKPVSEPRLIGDARAAHRIAQDDAVIRISVLVSEVPVVEKANGVASYASNFASSTMRIENGSRFN